MMESIGRIRRIPLKDVWPHEAHNFTPWLEANIDVLNDVLDINIVSLEREHRTESAFRVDLMAEDESGMSIVVENQYGRSNHDHLGKLLTYLSATFAKAAIWIVEHPSPEHVAAVTWLNETNSARFYLLKLEVVCIGDSAPAPLLTVIVQPSEDIASLGEVRASETERHALRQRWWTKLLEREDAKLHSAITAGPHSYIGTSSGLRGLGLNYAIRQNDCSVELYIDRGRDKNELNQAIFDELHAHKEEIEQTFGDKLSWEALEAKRACRIKYAMDGGYKSVEDDWQRIQADQVDAMNRLSRALLPFIRALDVEHMERVLKESDAERE